MRPLLCVLSLLCVAAPVYAQSSPSPEEQQSLEHYQKGVTAYDLGKFDEAVQEFQKAYEVKPTPAYLYNIAQAHRQKGDAAKALFFYKRYLQKSPTASNRDTVERRIAELEEQVKKQDEAKAAKELKEPKERPAKRSEAKRPEPKPSPPSEAVAAAAPPQPSATRPTADVRLAPEPEPRRSVVRLALGAGPGFVGLGDGPDVPLQVSVGAGVAFTLHFGDLAIDPGVAATLTPMPFKTLEQTASGTAYLVGLLGNITVRFAPTHRLDLRFEAGGGVSLMTGLTARNPFTDRGQRSDTLLMPTVRVAVGLDYAVAGSLRLTLTPSFAWSKASHKLDDRISAIIRLDVLLGVAVTL